MNGKKGKGRSILIIVFSAVLIMMGLYAQSLISQQTKVTMVEMAQIQSSFASEVAEEVAEADSEQSETTLTSESDVQGQAAKPVILEEYADKYAANSDMIGWLYIEDTKINYPVMQTPGDEEFYLGKNFEKEEDVNGSLIMDTDSVVGVGTGADGYADGMEPSDNLIVHGHTMNSGEMFGELDLYADEQYGKAHSVICFDSLYEKRKYELIAVFESEVFGKEEDVFKYYKFFNAETQAEFDDWYRNIKEMSLYDTSVTAEFGDEFITLSCCAYHTENGRFVVVAKRIQ